MELIRPFVGLRPARGRADEVIAPPYDVLDAAEARRRADGRPWSFLHISRAEIDLPEGTDPHDPAVYRRAAASLDAMVAAGVLIPDPAPCFYIYRLQQGDLAQTGLVAVASVAAYEGNHIRRHELTRPDKEDDRVAQIEALQAQTGPVLMAHQGSPGLAALLARQAEGVPEYNVVGDGGVRHTLWRVDDPAVQAEIVRRFDVDAGGDIDALYIADGHHRSAAAVRVAQGRRGHAGEVVAGSDAEWFLAVIFPAAEMQILDYNRVVADLNGLDARRFLTEVSKRFETTPWPEAVHPARRAEFGMYLDGHWYRLRFPAETVPEDPVARLDVSLLQDHLIGPVLGIADPRRDRRIDFVGGVRGLAELERRVDQGGMAVAFALHPTAMGDLMAVADAGRVMPPKSTWFEPKLADGLVSHVIR